MKNVLMIALTLGFATASFAGEATAPATNAPANNTAPKMTKDTTAAAPATEVKKDAAPVAKAKKKGKKAESKM